MAFSEDEGISSCLDDVKGNAPWVVVAEDKIERYDAELVIDFEGDREVFISGVKYRGSIDDAGVEYWDDEMYEVEVITSCVEDIEVDGVSLEDEIFISSEYKVNLVVTGEGKVIGVTSFECEEVAFDDRKVVVVSGEEDIKVVGFGEDKAKGISSGVGEAEFIVSGEYEEEIVVFDDGKVVSGGTET